MQLFGDEGDASIFGGDGNVEGLISAASEHVLYCWGSRHSFYGDEYGQRHVLYRGGDRDRYSADKRDYAPSSFEAKKNSSNW